MAGVDARQQGDHFRSRWWSHGCKRLLDASDGSGEPRLLADFKDLGRPVVVSPDKRLALMGRGEAGGISISTAPIEGDPEHPRLGKIELFVTGRSPNIWPAFSPDGQWVAYTSGDPGNRGVIVRAFPGPGGQWQIDSLGGFPAWSRKTHQLFYLSSGRIMVTDYTANGSTFQWEKPHVWSEKRLLDLGSPPYPTFDIAPDGMRAAVVLYTDGTAEEKPITSVSFLLNFFDYLQQRVPVKK